MRSFYALLIPVALFVLTSCEKELSYEGGLVPPPPTVPPPVPPPAEPTEEEKFATLLADNKFQLRAFYSNIPIDYNEGDAEIKQETDLWNYVAPYLKDDVNTFSGSSDDVTIEQNERKRPGLADSLLTRQYTIGTDEEGMYIIFLDYQYNPLQYRVHEFGEDYFILSIAGSQGATLFSRFEMIL
jgi:hypothetical protein